MSEELTSPEEATEAKEPHESESMDDSPEKEDSSGTDSPKSSGSSSSSSEDSVELKKDIDFENAIRKRSAFTPSVLKSLFRKDSKMQLFAFNTGQGNLMVLKYNTDMILVDAGGSLNRADKRFLYSLVRDNNVRYVFITHPHTDHFSVLLELIVSRKKEFSKCSLYLGGIEKEWMIEEESKNFIQLAREKLPSTAINYVDNKDLEIPSSKEHPYSIRVFGVLPLQKESKSLNKLSLIVQVNFAGKAILFTGDAEGEVFGRLFQRSASLKPLRWLFPEKTADIDLCTEIMTQFIRDPGSITKDKCKEYWDRFDMMAEKCKQLDTSQTLYELLVKDGVLEYSPTLLDDEKKMMITLHLVNVIKVRRAFRSSDIIIVPHHGSSSMASSNFLGFFSSLSSSSPKLFIVSSTPFGTHGLPKASILDCAPRGPKLFEHPFLYCREGLRKSRVHFALTKKPILLTSASPCGFQAVTISLKGEISIFDPTNRSDPWFEFPGSERERPRKQPRFEEQDEDDKMLTEHKGKGEKSEKSQKSKSHRKKHT